MCVYVVVVVIAVARETISVAYESYDTKIEVVSGSVAIM